MHKVEIDGGIGEFEKHDPVHYPKEKAIYKGEVKGGVREGRGMQIWKDGTVYMGEWKSDRINGKGMMFDLLYKSAFYDKYRFHCLVTEIYRQSF